MENAALVLEGGAIRGIFSAGVLDFLMERKVQFPYVASVSAGTCCAMSYLSGQLGRTRACMMPDPVLRPAAAAGVGQIDGFAEDFF